jgi:hypothetical protein
LRPDTRGNDRRAHAGERRDTIGGRSVSLRTEETAARLSCAETINTLFTNLSLTPSSDPIF